MSETVCPRCGKSLPADAPQGFCPQCLLGLGLDTQPPAGEAVKIDQPVNAPDNRETSPLYPPVSDLSIEALAAHFPQLEIIGLVGRGGMGVVYKARQPSLDRLVALKILPPEVSNDPSFAERFTREARALARLNHPNIVAIYDSGQSSGLYYFVMEYVDGVNLRQAILAEQITPAKALAIVPQICDALQYAHEEGLVHRDIKPENVLLDKKGRVKVADFGLAKLLGRATIDVSLTGTSQAMGTLHYMAPEQLETPLEVDHRADIYSLGVVFYELLTGRLPLGRFALPSENRGGVDQRLDDIVLKTLQREPDQRYQFAGDVKTDVETVSRFPTAPPAAPAQQFGVQQSVSPTHGFSSRAQMLISCSIVAYLAMPILCGTGAILAMLHVPWAFLGLLLVGTALCMVIGSVLLIAALILPRATLPSSADATPRKQGAYSEEELDRVEKKLRWPATLIFFAGILDVVILLLMVTQTQRSEFRASYAGILIWCLLQVVVVAVQILGAVKMRDLRSYSFVVFAAVVSALCIHPLFPLGLVVGIYALTQLLRADVRKAFAQRAVMNRYSGAFTKMEEQSPSPLFSPILATALCGIAIFVLVGMNLALLFGSRRVVMVASPAPHVSTKMATRVETSSYDQIQFLPVLDWPNGNDHVPSLGKKLPALLHLTPQQIDGINGAIETVHRDYLEAEAKHSKRSTNELGHQVVEIESFPKELEKLEDQFWTTVDELAPSEMERATIRKELALRGSIMPFGDGQRRYELWKVGTWYHFQSNGREQSGAQLPEYMAHLWKSKQDKEDDRDHND